MRDVLPFVVLTVVLFTSRGVPTAGRALDGAESSPPAFNRATMLAPAGGQPYDHFGTAVAISGNTAVIGAPLCDDRASDAGAAYVFVRSGGLWVEQAELLAADGAAFDNFGVSVAVSGDTILVGANLDDTAKGADSGSAYVFVRDGTTWSQQAKLVASAGTTEDDLGFAVALSADTAVVGARHTDGAGGTDAGAAYVFVRDGSSWSQQAELRASDGEAFDLFGAAVAVSGETVIVGALENDDNGVKAGSAYVFVRSGSSWSQQEKLLASDGQPKDNFGNSVAVSGDTALIGAPGDDDLEEGAGAAYVFVRSGSAWGEQVKLLSPDPGRYDVFGWSVALSGDTALIGAPGEDEGQAPVATRRAPMVPTSFRGSAYVFSRSGFVWTYEGNLQPKEITTYDEFGYSVSLDDTEALVGVWLDDPNGEDSGSAYAFGPDSLTLSVEGSCPGPATVTISNAPPSSEVGVVAAQNANGFTKSGALCSGTVLEIGEPFQLPPLWIKVGDDGTGTGDLVLENDRCWLEAMALAGCATSGAVHVP